MEIENEGKLHDIIEAFDKAGFLSDVILIGSWCLPFYCALFDDFSPNVRTTDVDFYVPDSRKAKAGEVISRLREIDYDHLRDTMTNKSRFVSPEGFEVEFLANLNREGLSCVRLGTSSIYAESLSYVEIFSKSFICVQWRNHSLKVASPAAFVLQKALINGRRGEKSEKDDEAISYVFAHILSSQKSRLECFSLLNGLPKKWQRRIAEYFSNKGIDVFDSLCLCR